MENIKRLFYDVDEAGQFLYSAISGITKGRADCDVKSIFLDGGAYKWMKSQNPFPVPFFMKIINLEAEDQERVLSRLPKILQEDPERIRYYLKTLIPFFRFSDSKRYNIVTEKGLTTQPINQIITPAQMELDSIAGWYNQDIQELVDMDTYMAVKLGNHRRFFQRFCPFVFEKFPGYAPLDNSQKSLIKRFAEGIIDSNPISSKELTDLVK